MGIHWLLVFCPFMYRRDIQKLIEKKYRALHNCAEFSIYGILIYHTGTING